MSDILMIIGYAGSIFGLWAFMTTYLKRIIEQPREGDPILNFLLSIVHALLFGLTSVFFLLIALLCRSFSQDDYRLYATAANMAIGAVAFIIAIHYFGKSAVRLRDIHSIGPLGTKRAYIKIENDGQPMEQKDGSHEKCE